MIVYEVVKAGAIGQEEIVARETEKWAALSKAHKAINEWEQSSPWHQSPSVESKELVIKWFNKSNGNTVVVRIVNIEGEEVEERYVFLWGSSLKGTREQLWKHAIYSLIQYISLF